MLALCRAQIATVLQTGAEYTIFGSRQVKNPPLADLLNTEKLYFRRVLAAKGWNGRTHADFNEHGSNDANLLQDA